jgi:VCBS repeat-containing protein
MPNRYTKFQFQYSYERELIHVYLQATIGATGAPTLSAANSLGVASISRNDVGDYTITLQNSFSRLMMVDQCQLLAGGVLAAPIMAVQSLDGSAKTITVQFQDETAAAEIDDGAVLRMHFVLSPLART